MKYALYSIVLAAALGATWFQWKFQQPPLRKFKAVPEFQLVERSGEPIRLADLRGKVWLADFFYTECPGPCPSLTSHFTSLQERLLQNPAVRLVSFSVNPEQDTPEVLRGYAEKFGASERWLFVTGPKADVRELVTGGFMQAALDQEDPLNPVLHGTKIALVDKHGFIRGFYEGGNKDENDQIVRDVARLLRE